MEIQSDEINKEISLLLRYAVSLFNNKNEKEKNQIGQNLVQKANQLEFFAYPTILMNNVSDPTISSAIRPHITDHNSEKIVLDMNQQDSHFIDSIGVSDIDNNIERIFEAYNNFYKFGNFDKFIRACYRFLKRIKGANEYEMNDMVIRYMISCICMNDYSNCINIIENIGQNYLLFDYNIYIFLLYLIQGKYDDASQKILLIQNNVSEDFNTYVNEDDLAFYFSFCLLYNFDSIKYKQILSENDTLVYKLYDKYKQYFEILDEYYKCDYLKVNLIFDKTIKPKIEKDPFLSGFLENIENKFKKKILNEILYFSSEIAYEDIQNILLLKNKDDALNMVIDLIKNEKIPAIIDDTEGIIIIKEKNPMNELLEKSNNDMKNKLIDLIKYSLNKNVRHKILSSKMSGEEIERKQLRENDLVMGLMSFEMPIQMAD